MNAPAAVVALWTKEGGTLEGDRYGGTWWKDGRRKVTWSFKKNGEVSINLHAEELSKETPHHGRKAAIIPAHDCIKRSRHPQPRMGSADQGSPQ